MGTCCARSVGTEDSVGETITEKADSMQEVVENVYMGSAVAAKNRQLLLNHGITHILAIGWNLETHYPDTFSYLLINKIEDSPECLIIKEFEKCFNFIKECFDGSQTNKLFVHCHKGLSRSATVVIAWEMYKRQTDFKTVLKQIRENRSFIMPNIGFQAQLVEFKRQQYSVDVADYSHFDVISFIQERLPKMLDRIKFNYNAYKNNADSVNETELFELTLYVHQVHKLRQKDKLNEHDIEILTESIKVLRDIQVEFVQNEASIKRFDIMFANKPLRSPSASPNKTAEQAGKVYGSVGSDSHSSLDRQAILQSTSVPDEQQHPQEAKQETVDEANTETNAEPADADEQHQEQDQSSAPTQIQTEAEAETQQEVQAEAQAEAVEDDHDDGSLLDPQLSESQKLIEP